ncbi:hypothetical protein [Geobacter sp. DSM 9736]|uniref:hypothetical protein n=1 Tax=Geobacter sp. DSM 9736 TaxID=1277350 RepID=UPI000B50AE34|nr:hypothetical protein [Geobacter sp. DSM 9736]SNB46954.1 hypothetical protein SAMN06269301_2428 [Geobacter sp. DSM 9736]
MRFKVLTIISMLVCSGCAYPVQKSFIKPNVAATSQYSIVQMTSSLIGYSPAPKDEVIIEKDAIKLTLHAFADRSNSVKIHLSIDPYEKSVNCTLNAIFIETLNPVNRLSPSKIICWHHGPHLNDNYMEEISGHVVVPQVKRPDHIGVTENRYILEYSIGSLQNKNNLNFVIPEIVLTTPEEKIIFGPISFEESTEKVWYFPGTM